MCWYVHHERSGSAAQFFLRERGGGLAGWLALEFLYAPERWCFSYELKLMCHVLYYIAGTAFLLDFSVHNLHAQKG